MRSPGTPHMGFVLGLTSAALVPLGPWACAGESSGEEGGGGEQARPEVTQEPPPESSPASGGEGQEPSGSGGSLPPTGPLDQCFSTMWTGPDEARREAACIQYWDESGDEPALRYVCSCDVEACPIKRLVLDGNDPGTPPKTRLNDCVVDGVESGCQDSLQSACGTTTGEHGFCEREYFGLTPTRPAQDPPEPVTIACFEQPDGTHACTCPDEPELTPTTEADCQRALRRTCQAPCESAAGRCEPGENGYNCACSAGFERPVETALCDYALFWACEPACSNEAGACYWDPSGGPQIICRCSDDTEPRAMDRDPNVMGDECRTPLVETCGGSAEGPDAWP